MVRAVCFNRKAFDSKVLNQICAQIGCNFLGYLTDSSAVNCLESFPDGSVFLSYVGQINKQIINCHSDIDKFITINTHYGNI